MIRKLIPGTALRDALKQIAQQPFRTVPYFDPGVWGWTVDEGGL